MDMRLPVDDKSPRRVSEQTNKINNWLIKDDVTQRDFLSDNNNKHSLKSDENLKEDNNKKSTSKLTATGEWLCKQETTKKDHKSSKKHKEQQKNNSSKSSAESKTKSEYENNKIGHCSSQDKLDICMTTSKGNNEEKVSVKIKSSSSTSEVTSSHSSKESKLETCKTESACKDQNKHIIFKRKTKIIDEREVSHKKRLKSDSTKRSENKSFKAEKHDKGKSERHKHRKDDDIKHHKDDSVSQSNPVKQQNREDAMVSKSTSPSASKSFCKDLDKEAEKDRNGTLNTIPIKQKPRNEDPATGVSPKSSVDRENSINVVDTSHSNELKRKYNLETSRNQEDYKKKRHKDKILCKEKDRKKIKKRKENGDRGESHRKHLKLEKSEQEGEQKCRKEQGELNPTKHEKLSSEIRKDGHKQNRIKSKKRNRYKTDTESNVHNSHRKQGNLDNFVKKSSKPNKVYKRIKFSRSDSSESCDLPCFENSNKKPKTSRSSESFKKYGVAIPSIEEILKEQKDLEEYKTQIEAFQDIERNTFELPFSINNLTQPVADNIKILDCKHLSMKEITEGFKKNLTYVSDILHGKTYNERHERFFSNKISYSTHTMKDLTYSTSVIVFSFDQKEHMIKLLKDEFDPDDKLTPYFFQVLLPELCLKLFMDTHEMAYEEAVKYLDVRPIVDD